MSLKQNLKHAGFTCLGAAHRLFCGSTPPLASIRNFVLLQYPSALGWAVHATPLIPALRAAVPDAEITVCASGFALEVLRGNPDISRLIETPNPTRSFLPAVRALKAALPRRERYATLTTTSNERTKIALAALLAGAENFVGFTLVPELYRAPLKFDRSKSQISNNLRIIESLGHPESTHFEPQMYFTDADRAYAESLIRRFPEPTRPLVALVTQTSASQRKSWRIERFTAVAEFLIERYGANILLLGARNERETVQTFADRIGSNARNVAGETNLNQLAALLSFCSVGLTLDTGILHVGRAVGLPMVVIAPAWSPPVEWLPIEDSRFRILKNLDMDRAPIDYIIDEVSVAEVQAALADLMNGDAAQKFPVRHRPETD